MKHPVFFLFFVFVTTSVINAIPHGLSKRATQFHPCGDGIPFLDVSLSPDPIVSGQNVTFSISGTATTDFGKATVQIVFSDDNDFHQEYTDDFCKLYKSCPVKKDTKFDFPFTIKPKNLPATYHIDVWVLETDTEAHCATAYKSPSPK